MTFLVVVAAVLGLAACGKNCGGQKDVTPPEEKAQIDQLTQDLKSSHSGDLLVFKDETVGCFREITGDLISYQLFKYTWSIELNPENLAPGVAKIVRSNDPEWPTYAKKYFDVPSFILTEQDLDWIVWDRAVTEGAVGAYENYIKNHPDGKFVEQAKICIEHLKKPAEKPKKT
jgi:hypothetical protein